MIRYRDDDDDHHHRNKEKDRALSMKKYNHP